MTDTPDAVWLREFLDRVAYVDSRVDQVHVARLRSIADRLESLQADNARLPRIEAAAKALFAAEHYDHFAARMSDGEMAAIDQLRAALAHPERDATAEEAALMGGSDD